MTHTHLIGMLLAASAGWTFVHHARGMIHEGVGVAEGGGYTALLMGAILVWFVGIALAMS